MSRVENVSCRRIGRQRTGQFCQLATPNCDPDTAAAFTRDGGQNCSDGNDTSGTRTACSDRTSSGAGTGGASLAPVIQGSKAAIGRTTRDAITGPSSGHAATITHEAQVGRLLIARSLRHTNLGQFGRMVVDIALTDIRRVQLRATPLRALPYQFGDNIYISTVRWRCKCYHERRRATVRPRGAE
jgi:hypothetical protein